MNLVTVARRNVSRNKIRFALTILAVALTFCAFVLLRTVVRAHQFFAENAAEDRLLVMHKAGLTMRLPMRYVPIVRDTPGVGVVHFGTQSGYRSPRHPKVTITGAALDPETLRDTYDEIGVDDDVYERWVKNRRSILLGDVLAKQLGLAAGDNLTLTRGPVDMAFEVAGIYRITRPGWTPRTVAMFHFDLFNELLPSEERDQVAVLIVRVAPGASPPAVAEDVSRRLSAQNVPVEVRSERAQTVAVLSRFSSILAAIDAASIAIVLLMLLIIANTLAMGIRERTREFAVLRSIGFTKGHIMLAIGAEGLVVGLIAAAVGMALSVPVVGIWMPGWIAANSGAILPYWDPGLWTYVMAVTAAVTTSLFAAAFPAWRIASLPVTEAMRHVG